MEKTKPKVIVIGLDSADPALILRWCDSGDLPTLARLREQGTWGRLDTFPGFGDDAAWCSFSTGMHPGCHGRYHFLQFDSDSHATTRVRDEFLTVSPFWVALSEAGQSVAVIDVPKSPLTPGLNGVQLSDWRVHGRDGATRSVPPDLASRVIATHGDDDNDVAGTSRFLCSPWFLDEGSRRTLLRELENSVQRKTDLLEELLDEQSWDLFLAVFKESHCAGHQFWHLLSESKGDSDSSEWCMNPLKTVYQALDTAVGRLLTRADKKTTVIVFSNLGMSDNYSGEHLLDAVLLRLDRNPLLRVWQQIFYRYAGYRHLDRLLRKVNKRLRRLRSAVQLPHNEISGAIRVNLKGRERHGRIPAGDQFTEYCDRLELALKDLRDPESGQFIVEEVIRPASSLEGPQVDHLPDLLVVWNREFPIRGACSPGLGEIRLPTPPYRPGNHVPGGVYFSIGPGSGRGKQATSSSIVDLAPTIAAVLGVTLPVSSGAVIAALDPSDSPGTRG